MDSCCIIHDWNHDLCDCNLSIQSEPGYRDEFLRQAHTVLRDFGISDVVPVPFCYTSTSGQQGIELRFSNCNLKLKYQHKYSNIFFVTV